MLPKEILDQLVTSQEKRYNQPLETRNRAIYELYRQTDPAGRRIYRISDLYRYFNISRCRFYQIVNRQIELYYGA